MTDPAVTAKQLVDLARKHIEDQQSRIARQRELMAKLWLAPATLLVGGRVA